MVRSVVILGLAGLSAVSEAQERVPLMDSATVQAASPAAQESLQKLGQLVTPDNARALGFESPAEARTAALGAPVQALVVRLDDLRQYTAAQPASRILRSVERVIFPVVTSGGTRSSVTVARAAGEWRTHSMGAPTYMRSFDAVRAQLAAQEGLAPTSYFEVRVPALNVAFVARLRAGQLFLTPVVDDRRFAFQRGATLVASDALARLVPAARAHNGLPT